MAGLASRVCNACMTRFMGTFFSFQMQGMYRLFDRKGGIFFEREEIR